MDTQKIVDHLTAKLASYPADYFSREFMAVRRRIDSRRVLGVWCEEEAPDVDGAVDRLSWLLNGSYGGGEALYSWNLIVNTLHGKTGKNVDRAWLAIGRELTLLVALFDSTEYTFQKITACWKAAGVDFHAVNLKAGAAIHEYLVDEIGEQK